MPATRRFSKQIVSSIDEGGILGIRAGDEAHRLIGVWVVVVNGRVFVRPWNDKALGWRRAFLADPVGLMQISTGRKIRIRARVVRGERLNDAIDAAYATKYHTPASKKWVRGFATAKRRATTMELLPR
jgi:hypothetical protein